MQPAFHSRRIYSFAETMTRRADRLIAHWQDGEARDLSADMMRLTLRIVCEFDPGGRDDYAALAVLPESGGKDRSEPALHSGAETWVAGDSGPAVTEFRRQSKLAGAPMYPPKLNNIINLFESLPEDERRETLVSYADNAKKQEPRAGEHFDLEDIRKDEECADTVGVYLHVDEQGKAHIRMTLGPEVQTLTRAMTAILCKGLEGATPQEILDLPSDFVTRIIGAELVRVRSQTTYYVLTRIKGICKVYLDRQRRAVA